MNSMNHIVYLSSDEEDDQQVDITDWFDGVLETSDEKPKITFIKREKKKRKRTGHRKSNSSDLKAEDEDGDDDCVVLDCDPYKKTAKEPEIDTCETDEVVVVGQKGEIACRDFPHPRHACAKYPFDSTSHEKYCDMCHCYVCDIRAPCPYWCISISSIDHCHANNKEPIWNNQRECIRTGEILPRPASTIAQLQQLSQSQNSWYYPATQCATHPNTHIRPGYRREQSRTFPQNPRLQPCAGRRPSRGGIPNISQGSQHTHHAPLQGKPQRIVTGHISTVPESHTKVYARHFNRSMYSGNVQTGAVSSETPNPPVNQQQQQQQQKSGRSKELSEFEDWLMGDTIPTGPVCPVSGEDNATTFAFDFETFLK